MPVKDGNKMVKWSDDERSLLTEQIIEAFEKKDLPFDRWIVTVHDITKAQYALFAEDRCRPQIPRLEEPLFQTRVQLRITEKIEAIALAERQAIELQNTTILNKWREFAKLHGCTYEEQNAKLEREISTLRATAFRTTHVDPARSGAATMPSNRVIEKLQPVGEQITADLKLLLINPHMPQIARQLIDLKGIDVVWTDNKDDASALRRKADGRHVFLTSGVLGTHAARALKDTSLSFQEIPGGNSRFSTVVAEFIAQHRAA